MRIGRANLLNLGLVILAFVAAAALYDRLPASIPIHWNARGEANGFAPKSWGAFLMPGVMAAVYLLFGAIPRMSPRGFRVERFRRVYEIFETTILAFLLLTTVLILLAGVGVKVPMDRTMYAGIGLVFVVLGNFMGKVTRNFFVGIRTPWTLASDEVWLRTHRLGGKLFVLAGIGLCVSGLLRGGLIPLLAAVAIAGVVPVIYSYVLYRRIEGRPTDVRVPPGR
jgi:uncharacterized membrane protein